MPRVAEPIGSVLYFGVIVSYVVLARRYRPQTFSEVIGQEHITGTLLRAIRLGRIGHAYLFGGPRGVGKTTVARILAKSLNCENKKEAEPCGVCDSCIQITEGRSVNVLELDAASNRGVDDVRGIRENVRFSSSAGAYRIVIVDEVHMFTKEAFNAFLKTLEEPPEHVVFILATTDVHQVPATVLSRCQRFEFRRLEGTEVANHLIRMAKEEGIQLELGAAAIMARRSDGSLRDGISLLDQMIAFCGKNITESDVVTALGLIKSDRFFEVTRVILEKDTSATFPFIANLMDAGADLSDFLRGLMEHFLTLLRVNVMQTTDQLPLTPEEKLKFEEVAPLFQSEDLLRMLKLISDTDITLRGSYNPRLRIELLLQRLVRMENTVDIATILQSLQVSPSSGPSDLESKKKPKLGVIQTSESKNAPLVDTQVLEEQSKEEVNRISESIHTIDFEFSKDQIQLNWQLLCATLRRISPFIGTSLTSSKVIDVMDNKIVIEVLNENRFGLILKQQPEVEKLFSELFSKKIRIQFTIPEITKNPTGNKSKAELQKQLEELVSSNQFVKELIEKYDFKLITE